MANFPNWSNLEFTGTRWSVIRPRAYYVSKSGNDDTNDGSPRRPFKTVAGAIAYFNLVPIGQREQVAIICSSGLYLESELGGSSLNGGAPWIMNIIGDGLVIFEGVGSAALTSNCPAKLESVTVQGFICVSYAQANFEYVSCRFRNLNCVVQPAGDLVSARFERCLFEYVTEIALPNHKTTTINNCTLIRSNLSHRTVYSEPRNMRNSYIGPGCTINVDPVDYFDYNNVEGGIVSKGEGVFAPVGLPQYRSAHPGKAENCIQTNPLFNDPANGDYTLAQNSPMRNLSIEGTYAGSFGVGLTFGGLGDAETLINARWDSGLMQFVPVNPALMMSVEFVTKDTGRVWILEDSYLSGIEDNVDKQTIDSTYSYENVGGVPTNTPSGAIIAGKGYWVTGYDSVIYNGKVYSNDMFLYGVGSDATYATTGNGKVVLLTEMPNVRLMEMRYSSTSQGDCDSRSYKLFMVNRQPTYNTAGGRSNGDANFNYGAQEPLSVRWLKVRLTILPNTIA